MWPRNVLLPYVLKTGEVLYENFQAVLKQSLWNADVLHKKQNPIQNTKLFHLQMVEESIEIKAVVLKTEFYSEPFEIDSSSFCKPHAS